MSSIGRRQARKLHKTLWTPPPIQNVQDSGLTENFIEDMALRVMYAFGQLSGLDIAAQLRLPFEAVIRPRLDALKRKQFCEIKGASGLGAATYQYLITNKGGNRARELMERTTYADAAPVPWESYVSAIKKQANQQLTVNPSVMQEALANLTLEESVFAKIGPAVNSGKSIFLYGPPGNGKTTIAECIGRLILKTDIYIPYAVEVDGQIIKVFDEINHVEVPEAEVLKGTGALNSQRPDARWVRIKRPVIMVGGELTLDGLELSYDNTHKFYEAPFQMKANGGMFLIDDFGRQQIRPRDLLNRWVVPMEKNVDFLALRTGRKLEVPFEVLIVFSTNLPPRDLVDEAFLRRIRHKIHVTAPTYEGYRGIFEAVCQGNDVPYDPQAVVYLLQEYYVKTNRKLRANHPRDLIQQLTDVANYLGIEPRLSKDLLDQAADSYFVDI